MLISWFETLTAIGLHNIIVSSEVLIGGPTINCDSRNDLTFYLQQTTRPLFFFYFSLAQLNYYNMLNEIKETEVLIWEQ